ncbi:MAG TPA: hypothetical protein V6C91_03615 [Coleofasciculaceae cyanobacterium]
MQGQVVAGYLPNLQPSTLQPSTRHRQGVEIAIASERKNRTQPSQ